MSDPTPHPPPSDPALGEEVDALPVPVGVRPLEGPQSEPDYALALRSPVPMQVAVAATGFVAGAATVAVLRRRRAQRESRRRRRAGGGNGLTVLGSRSFLVDVHLLGGRDN